MQNKKIPLGKLSIVKSSERIDTEQPIALLPEEESEIMKKLRALGHA